MINYLKATLGLSTLLILAGCGGSGSNNTTVDTGIGYYQDEAIVGVDYKCGLQIGKTGEEGKFTFEENSDCSFSIAGIPLRKVKADELKDGGKVFEDNINVVRFLASIDDDGNILNGLTINDEMLSKLEAAVKEIKDPKQVLENNTTMETVVENTGKELVPETIIKEHLEKRETQYIKELIEGKTFYIIDGDKIKKLTVGKFEDDTITLTFSHLYWQNIKVYHATIDGKSIYDEDGVHVISKDTKKYILGFDKHGEFKLYYNLDDAKAELQKQSQNAKKTIKDILAGKTVYIADVGELDEWKFNSNMTKMETPNNGTADITVTDKSFTIDNTETFTLVGYKEGQYVLLHDKDGDNNENFKAYFNKADAEKELGYNSSLYKLLAGHTYYQAVTNATTEENGETVPFPHVEKFSFNSNGTYTDSWEEGGETHTHTFNYEIIGDNQLRVYGINSDGDFDVTLNFEKQDEDSLYFNNGFVLYNSEDIAKEHLN